MYVYICIYVCVYRGIWGGWVDGWVYVCIWVYMYVCVHVCTYVYVYGYMDIDMYVYRINLRTAAISLFEGSSPQRRLNEALNGPECSNVYHSKGVEFPLRLPFSINRVFNLKSLRSVI